MNSSVDLNEIEKFERIANEWWDVDGKFKPLHLINPLRLKFIREQIEENFQGNNIEIIDIGCGGGLVAEPIAKKGYKVFAIDASKMNIDIAIHHSKGLDCDLKYERATPEDIASRGQKFDVVLALEIIEHVSSVEAFLESVIQLLKPGGILVISTINRNVKSYLTAILAAEYILGWLPRGTHQWSKFLKPSEISSFAANLGLNPIALKGFKYNILMQSWYLTDEVDVNYIMTLKKI